MGNSDTLGPLAASTPVHPHGCGELLYADLPWEHGYGSSPRVWGTRTPAILRSVRLRFIPTGVGNSLATRRRPRRHTVHPHGCGELRGFTDEEIAAPGSSPRVWGTLGILPAEMQVFRFIPTGVGNSVSCPLILCSLLVHPHGCGELAGHSGHLRASDGSSPRVWGTLTLSDAAEW